MRDTGWMLDFSKSSIQNLIASIIFKNFEIPIRLNKSVRLPHTAPGGSIFIP